MRFFKLLRACDWPVMSTMRKYGPMGRLDEFGIVHCCARFRLFAPSAER